MRIVSAALLAALCLGAVSCAQTPVPATGKPTTVAAAVEATLALLDEANRKKLAYMRDDELVSLHHGFGMAVRAQFDLWGDNAKLLKDCQSPHPDDCSMEVIERLHARLRAGLPAEERARLEKLEAGMDRVRLAAREFRDTPLPEFVAYLQKAIDTQLSAPERFSIRFAPADAGERVFIEVRDGSLHELYMDMFTHLEFSKAPPDLWVKPA